MKFGTKTNLGTQNPNMDEIFENFKKWAGQFPQNGALTPKNGSKSKNTPIDLKIGTVTNFSMQNSILESVFENND